MADIGNFKRSPGCNISLMSAAACEMGDMQTVSNLLNVADKHMKRFDDKNVLASLKVILDGRTKLHIVPEGGIQ